MFDPYLRPLRIGVALATLAMVCLVTPAFAQETLLDISEGAAGERGALAVMRGIRDRGGAILVGDSKELTTRLGHWFSQIVVEAPMGKRSSPWTMASSHSSILVPDSNVVGRPLMVGDFVVGLGYAARQRSRMSEVPANLFFLSGRITEISGGSWGGLSVIRVTMPMTAGYAYGSGTGGNLKLRGKRISPLGQNFAILDPGSFSHQKRVEARRAIAKQLEATETGRRGYSLRPPPLGVLARFTVTDHYRYGSNADLTSLIPGPMASGNRAWHSGNVVWLSVHDAAVGWQIIQERDLAPRFYSSMDIEKEDRVRGTHIMQLKDGGAVVTVFDGQVFDFIDPRRDVPGIVVEIFLDDGPALRLEVPFQNTNLLVRPRRASDGNLVDYSRFSNRRLAGAARKMARQSGSRQMRSRRMANRFRPDRVRSKNPTAEFARADAAKRAEIIRSILRVKPVKL